MIHPHDIRQPRHADRHGVEVRIDAPDRPHADHPARSRDRLGMFGRNLAAVRTGAGGHRGVRQDQRFGGHQSRALYQIERPVRHVHHDTQAVAAADYLRPKIGQPAMHRWFCLDIAQLVHAVMGQLQMTQRPAVVGFVHPVQPAFQKIGALGRNNHTRRAGRRGSQIGRGCNDAQTLGFHQLMYPFERQHAVVVKFPGGGVSVRPDAAIDHAMGRAVRHHREAYRRHAPLPHRCRDRRKIGTGTNAALAGDVAGMRVQIDRGRAADDRARGGGAVFGAGRAGCNSEAHQWAGHDRSAPGHALPARRIGGPSIV